MSKRALVSTIRFGESTLYVRDGDHVDLRQLMRGVTLFASPPLPPPPPSYAAARLHVAYRNQCRELLLPLADKAFLIMIGVVRAMEEENLGDVAADGLYFVPLARVREWLLAHIEHFGGDAAAVAAFDWDTLAAVCRSVVPAPATKRIRCE